MNADLRADIQDLGRTHKALRESEDRYRTIFETIQEDYFETDLRGKRPLNGRRIHDDPLHY